MRYLVLLCLFIFSTASAGVTSSAEVSSSGAVAYSLNTGRLGDNLLTVAHAAWFSHVLELPLVYQPFTYSDRLCIDNDPNLLRARPPVPNILKLKSAKDYLSFYRAVRQNKKLTDILIEVPFYPESSYLFEDHPNQAQFTKVNWKDPEFHATLRNWIAPKNPIPKLNLPSNKTTVALHYRTGEVYDKKHWKLRFPLKGPPDEFYIDCLNYLHKIESKPLYVHIFTDSPHPAAVKKKFKKLFPHAEFNIFIPEKGQDTVLEDFFSMDGFKCLIRPESNFSIVAGYLFPFQIILSPVNFRWNENKTITVDQILLEYNPKGAPSFSTTLRKS